MFGDLGPLPRVDLPGSFLDGATPAKHVQRDLAVDARFVRQQRVVLSEFVSFDFPCGGNLLCVVVVVVIVLLATSTRRSARRCPRCQEINRPHAIYCAQCGAKLQDK